MCSWVRYIILRFYNIFDHRKCYYGLGWKKGSSTHVCTVNSSNISFSHPSSWRVFLSGFLLATKSSLETQLTSLSPSFARLSSDFPPQPPVSPEHPFWSLKTFCVIWMYRIQLYSFCSHAINAQMKFLPLCSQWEVNPPSSLLPQASAHSSTSVP